ncbi:MAG: beta-L-arabinofuranosidase domain-containing protein [Phycisphaerae bacterium]
MKTIHPLITAGLLTLACLSTARAQSRPPQPQDPDAGLTNLALIATASTSYCSPDQTISAINDGAGLRVRGDHSPILHYGNWPTGGTQWVEYTWAKPISTNKVSVLWYDDGRGLHLPKACRIKYWNGSAFVEVQNAKGLGLSGREFNSTTFDEVKTDRIRLEMDAEGPPQISTGITEFRVFDSGRSPAFPPTVNAGIERDVVLGGRTFLQGTARTLRAADQQNVSYEWSAQGPGQANFEDPKNADTSATFTALGDYTVTLTATADHESASSQVLVHVKPAAPEIHADSVFTRSYSLDSPLWNARAKALVTHWIPHLIDYLEHPEKHLTGKIGKDGKPVIFGAGGIDNFIEAGKKIHGEPTDAKHLGPPWSDAYTHNTVEAMCVALTIDAKGDPEMIAAQKQIKETLDRWIPIILAAQEPDGYLQTRFTLNGGNHWDPRTRGEHEGYTAGYFIESAIADYVATDGKDMRMYNAAKKLADCWYKNVGPESSNKWFDGHQEIEQALVRFARLVDQVEGPHTGDKYVRLAKTLLDNRRGGTSYDQSHLPVTQQYEALGHAVRASYTYSGMAAVSEETGDLDYQSAVQSLWDSIVNRKYYITGGIGSGETSEGFGPNYSLRNNSYCESCSNCGELFFQYSLNLQYRDAKYADLYEGTLYNAILGDTDLAGNNFCYTNALDTTDSPQHPARYPWHDCPCCVGNIPRTLLQLPTWMYNTTADSVAINLFVGSTFTVKGVAGTDLQIIQKTDYPWNGDVGITLNPATPRMFTVKVRVPQRDVSTLYQVTPNADGITSIALNGETITPKIEKGYALITREWKAGDRIDLVLPMKVQRVKAIEKVAADRGRVALMYGPLVYNIESVDQNVDNVLADDAPLHAEWDPNLLGGVMVIKGQFTNGSPMVAIPNYARLNRGGRSIVWIKDE